MGIKVAWSDAAIDMTWPSGERLPVWLDSGCPVVDDKVGKQLMQQIEEHNMRIAGIKKVFKYGDKAQGGDLIGEEDANQAMELSQLFPEVPHWLIGRIPGAPEVDNEKVPLNRRTRRRIREAGTRILHLFSGKKTSGLGQIFRMKVWQWCALRSRRAPICWTTTCTPTCWIWPGMAFGT